MQRRNIGLKIKVITLKGISVYLVKIGVILLILSIFTNFFYNKKNVDFCISFDIRKYIGVIDKEILVFRNNKNEQIFNENYAIQTVSKELEVADTIVSVDSNNLLDNWGISLDINNKVNENIENKEIEENVNFEAVSIEVMPSNVIDKATYEVFGVKLRNESDYNLQNEITDLNIDINKQDILLFHTHTCESYTPTEQYSYEATGTFRTTDLNYTVSRVADELEKHLGNYGYNIVHDKSYHDYPAYTGSYDRSLITVRNLLSTYTNTDVVIDLHRDAIGDNTYAPKVKINGEYCARLMFVIGTDGGGLKHDGWRENLKFAIKVQQKANELYPGLFKPIIVRNSRYNHHLSSAACIIEVGATGNTLEECMNSMKYLAKVYDTCF